MMDTSLTAPVPMVVEKIGVLPFNSVNAKGLALSLIEKYTLSSAVFQYTERYPTLLGSAFFSNSTSDRAVGRLTTVEHSDKKVAAAWKRFFILIVTVNMDGLERLIG